MVPISLFSHMIFSKKAATFWDQALDYDEIGLNLNPAVGVGRAADFCDFSTKSCCVSRVRGVAASATDGPKGKL
ncbi:MAG: hypothetical protein ACLP4V_26320, partial [Methylocella sp.]